MVELLVTISVIAIITSLMMTAVLSSLNTARRAKCVNHFRQLTAAMIMYTDDNSGWFPPNDESGRTQQNWINGDMSKPEEALNREFVTNPHLVKLFPYHGSAADLYRCPSDQVLVADRSPQPRVRTVSMNQAVGSRLFIREAVAAPWLDGEHMNASDDNWLRYGSLSTVQLHGAADLWLLIDERAEGVNDGAFAVSMRRPTMMVDWPASRHSKGASISYVDGHVELRKWRDERTKSGGVGPRRHINPENPDVIWLQKRTSKRSQ